MTIAGGLAQYPVLPLQLTTYLPLQALRVERRRPLLRIGRIDKDKQSIPLGAARSTQRHIFGLVCDKGKAIKDGFYRGWHCE